MEAALQKIQFHYLLQSFSFPERNRLKMFLLKQLQESGREVEMINFIFCNDEYLLSINQQYLQHDTLTDIITFEHSSKSQPLISDIFISIERVKENAETFQAPFIKELRRVIFHGVLHLIGYNDKTENDRMEMSRMEEKFLISYKVSRSTV